MHTHGTRPGIKRMKSAMRDREMPVGELTIYFVMYKATLLGLATLASYTVYDSSSKLLGGTINHWDQVYFAHIAEQGYTFEQEFAFGPLLPWLTRYINHIVLGCLCHWISVLAFYNASFKATSSERVAKLSALLHILHPAGIFLCVGYTESLYSALFFSALAILHSRPFLSAGLFGLSGLTRATGITSAIFFLPRRPEPLRFLKAGVYALIIVLPWAATQVYAYRQYCPGRPWCDAWPPLIYSYVQDHYWNVGFGRYFTLSNLPLFIISAPMYILCFKSLDFSLLSVQHGLLAFITFTSAHAQIITRMSSSFPRIYWFVARKLVSDPKGRWSMLVVVWVGYGLIQAILFGAFLPPA